MKLRCLTTLLVAIFLTGCSVKHTVPLGTSSGSMYGGIKLYSTDNVPFEYEELGYIAQSHSKDAGIPPDECVRLLVDKARKLGADSIVNFQFHYEAGTGGFFLVLTIPNGYYNMSGVAVKIKRP